jgi:hypothetical protein
VQLYGHIGFYIATNVRGIAVVLGLVEVFVRHTAYGGLQRVDLWKHHWQVKRAVVLVSPRP